MGLASMLLGLVLAGGSPAAEVRDEPATSDLVRFQIHFLEMKGVDWRAGVHGRLQPLDSEKTSSVWTAPEEVVADLQQASDKTVSAPAVSAFPDAMATISDVTVRNHVADVRRVADGPEGQNTCVALVPVLASLRDGFEAKLSGHREQNGVQVACNLSNTRFVAFHNVSIPKTYQDIETKETHTARAIVQVPEVVKTSAAGQWLVPDHSVLVVSLGTYSTTDAQGECQIHERIAVIAPSTPMTSPKNSTANACPVAADGLPAVFASADEPKCVQPLTVPFSTLLSLASPTIAPQPTWRSSLEVTASAGVSSHKSPAGLTLFGVPLPVSLPPFVNVDVKTVKRDAEMAARPMPVVPGRTLPTAIAADGTVVPLPPLPDEDLAVASEDESAEPRPSPQIPRRNRPATAPAEPLPERESSLARVTRFEARGNTLVIRDTNTGSTKVICEDLVLAPTDHLGTRDTANLAEGEAPCCSGEVRTLVNRNVVNSTLRRDGDTIPVEYFQQDQATIEPEDVATLGFQLNSSLRGCEYDSTVSVKNLAKEPITLRIPMADGSVVEVTAKVVKPSSR